MNAEKVDKGIEIYYYNLSYRRRFIRTIWIIPLGILALILIGIINGFRGYLILIIIALAIGGFIQATYNYKKWKEELSSE